MNNIDPEQIIYKFNSLFHGKVLPNGAIGYNVKEFKCKSCGECCKNQVNVHLGLNDIINISEYLKLSHENFLLKYTRLSTPLDNKDNLLFSIKNTKPCMFLKNKICSIHDVKPMICNQYPFVRDLMQYVGDTAKNINENGIFEYNYETCELNNLNPSMYLLIDLPSLYKRDVYTYFAMNYATNYYSIDGHNEKIFQEYYNEAQRLLNDKMRTIKAYIELENSREERIKNLLKLKLIKKGPPVFNTCFE